jgi:hypothetical protein
MRLGVHGNVCMCFEDRGVPPNGRARRNKATGDSVMSKKTPSSKTPKPDPKASAPAKKRTKVATEVLETETVAATPAVDANVAYVAAPEVAPQAAPTEAVETAAPTTPHSPALEPEANPAVTDATAGQETPTPAPTTTAKKTPKAPKEPKKPSGLDAAAQVLAEKGEPMTCKDIVDTMLTKGLWTTGGKTPAATIYSAMLREIDGKPGESRFVKTGRGLFALTMTPTTPANAEAASPDGPQTV